MAIGYRAIQNGFETLFTTAAELIEDLSNASNRGSLQESLATYTHPHALIIDEVGYLTYGPDAANVLFHVVNDRHLRKRPMIFTTNKPLNEWGKVLHDEDMAAAILDRVLERGRFIHLDGPSGRTRHLHVEENLPENAKRLRISGISGSDFPEPTLLESRDDVEVCGEATNGEEAVQKSLQLNPDLIILDVTMPVLERFQCILNSFRIPQAVGLHSEYYLVSECSQLTFRIPTAC